MVAILFHLFVPYLLDVVRFIETFTNFRNLKTSGYNHWAWQEHAKPAGKPWVLTEATFLSNFRSQSGEENNDKWLIFHSVLPFFKRTQVLRSTFLKVKAIRNTRKSPFVYSTIGWRHVREYCSLLASNYPSIRLKKHANERSTWFQTSQFRLWRWIQCTMVFPHLHSIRCHRNWRLNRHQTGGAKPDVF